MLLHSTGSTGISAGPNHRLVTHIPITTTTAHVDRRTWFMPPSVHLQYRIAHKSTYSNQAKRGAFAAAQPGKCLWATCTKHYECDLMSLAKAVYNGDTVEVTPYCLETGTCKLIHIHVGHFADCSGIYHSPTGTMLHEGPPTACEHCIVP